VPTQTTIAFIYNLIQKLTVAPMRLDTGIHLMITIIPTPKETRFINAYFEAIDFTETGDLDQLEAGTDLDSDFERESILDCLAFFSRIQCYLSDDNIPQAGHDFWLTRNGHGTGFWDRKDVYAETHADLFTTWAEYADPADAMFKV
jgi:hypothetical protein